VAGLAASETGMRPDARSEAGPVGGGGKEKVDGGVHLWRNWLCADDRTA
jgi:hypothetical protein